MQPKLLLMLLISNICPGNCFYKFKRDYIRDGYICANVAFDWSNTPTSKCTILCAIDPECKRLFVIPEDDICIGCLTFDVEASHLINSVSYVPGDYLTYRYMGCFSDYSDYHTRVLNGGHVGDWPTLTNDFCFNYCIVDRGFIYFGTQNGDECFCGNSYEGSVKKTDDECDMSCTGDVTKTCGGGWKNSLYVSH